MENEKKDKGFVEIEKVRVIQTRNGEELHFTVVEVNGKTRGDIRFFVRNEENEDTEEMIAAKRGISILPRHFKAFQEGVAELGEKLAETQKPE
jgi:hypothetical protein